MSVLTFGARGITQLRMMPSAAGVYRRKVSRLAAAGDLTGDTVMETLAQSFEVREGAAPVSVPSDTASPTIPRAYLASKRAALIPDEKAHFCDGNHGANATIALISKA